MGQPLEQGRTDQVAGMHGEVVPAYSEKDCCGVTHRSSGESAQAHQSGTREMGNDMF